MKKIIRLLLALILASKNQTLDFTSNLENQKALFTANPMLLTANELDKDPKSGQSGNQNDREGLFPAEKRFLEEQDPINPDDNSFEKLKSIIEKITHKVFKTRIELEENTEKAKEISLHMITSKHQSNPQLFQLLLENPAFNDCKGSYFTLEDEKIIAIAKILVYYKIGTEQFFETEFLQALLLKRFPPVNSNLIIPQGTFFFSIKKQI